MQKSQADLIRDLERVATRMRRNSIRMTTEAGSGHPTTSMSAADVVAALFFHALRFDVKNPSRADNDRFVLSKGHGSPLLYAAWAEAGAIDPSELLDLRKLDSRLEGHPTPRFPGVDAATGSLGQGLSIGTGMALAGKMDRMDYRVYVLLGDGETAEGAVWEAAALAGHHGLDNLIGIVDVNRLGQSQATMLGHDVGSYARRFGSFGWHSIEIDGHDFEQILSALDEARRVRGQPVMIVAQTIKGKGVSFLENEDGWHGKVLDEDQMKKALEELRLDGEQVRLQVRPPEGESAATQPKRAGGKKAMQPPDYEVGDSVATRTAYGTGLRKLGAVNPRVVAVDGDVMGSTRAKKFLEEFPERFIEGFIAEQNMVGMAVGLQVHGKVPFVATFACFLTRAFDFIRMAAITRANLKLCGSHAGVSIGEDGPSQMGLEDLAMMRATPGAVVLYPSDAVSAERMVELAAEHEGIAYIRTTRPKTPVIYENHHSFRIGGCETLRCGKKDRVTIVAAGITLHEALKAYDRLHEDGIDVRVIDLYSVQPIDSEALLGAAAETAERILTVEDHYPAGGIGEAVASAVAPHGVRVDSLSVREVPRSGAPEELLDRYGISADAITRAVRALLAQPHGRASATG